jgi:hypothetical protein
MKKILVLLVLIGFLTSCGPHRLRCGPGRCYIKTFNEIKNPSIEGFFYDANSKRFNKFLVNASCV